MSCPGSTGAASGRVERAAALGLYPASPQSCFVAVRPHTHLDGNSGATCGVRRTPLRPLRVTHVKNTPLAFHSALRTHKNEKTREIRKKTKETLSLAAPALSLSRVRAAMRAAASGGPLAARCCGGPFGIKSYMTVRALLYDGGMRPCRGGVLASPLLLSPSYGLSKRSCTTSGCGSSSLRP